MKLLLSKSASYKAFQFEVCLFGKIFSAIFLNVCVNSVADKFVYDLVLRC